MKKLLLNCPAFILSGNIISYNKFLKKVFLFFLSFTFFIAVNAIAQNPANNSKITEYPNGVYKMEPVVFGITQSVRNLPTVAEKDSASKEFLTSEEKREEARRQLLIEKGLSAEEIEKDEINQQNSERVKKTQPNAGAGQGLFVDPLVNRNLEFNSQRRISMPTPILTFDGATQLDNTAQGIGAVHPPDVNGDVGLNHYVSSVNLVYKIFNKNGTVAAGPFKTSDLFSGLPAGDPCRINNDGDPVVVYDPLADRWHISQFALTGATNCQCVAVSVSGDPTGAYYVWRYNYPNNLLNDYPKVGVWTDAYHMTFNQFNNAGTAFLGMGILSQDRPKALAGDPTTSVVYTNIATIDPNAGGGLPADIDGLVPPPAGMAEVIAEFRATEFGDPNDAIRYYRWVPDFITPGSSSISVLPDVVLAPFDARSPATRLQNEVSGGANLDAISDRLMHRFAYRNLGTQAIPVNSFVGNFSVNVSGVNPTTAATFQPGIRWFEMRRIADVFSVFDQGTHNLTPGNGGTGLNNWMGSIAQDNKGNLALGFSQSSTTQRADIKIAGRTNNVLNSGILNEGEALFFAANGSQTSTSGRWGDYSSMNVDPVDGCTFWYTQEYYAATSSAGWSTRVGNFILPGCTPEAKATIQGTITFCAGGLPISGASVNATGGFNRVTGAPGTYSMTVSPGTYTVSAFKGVGFLSNNAPPVTVANGETAIVNLCLTGFPVLASTSVSLISESCSPANGVIDPGETVTVAFGVQNSGAANTVNDIGTLQATGGVTNPGASQNYGVIVVGGATVSRNFTFTADPALLCGANITATIAHIDGADNLGSMTYTLPTGLVGAATTISYSGPSVAIPDNVPAGVNIVLPVSGVVGAIADLNFRLDALSGCDNVSNNPNASVTHTFNSDLSFKLTSPGGTTVALISNRGGGANNFCTVLLDDDGGFPAATTIPSTGGVSGNFTPESPLSVFDGQDANGNWTLNVSDNAAIDIGTLNRFSLIFSGTTCCIAAPLCDISSVNFLGSPSSCNDNGTPFDISDDFFTQNIQSNFINRPLTGDLQIVPGGDEIGTYTIPVASIVGNTHTFTGVKFKADGTPTVISMNFTDEPTCSEAQTGPSVQACSTPSCTNSTPFESATIDLGGSSVTISTCSFAGEYSTINGAVAGQNLTFTSSVPTDYISIHTGTPSGPVIAAGTTALSFANTFTGTLYAHWNTPNCGSQSNCRTTTVQCTNCINCVMTCPANITVPNDVDQCGALVNFDPPSTTGTCGAITANPAPGSFFNVGTTIVNVSSEVGTSCSFTVTVEDNQPPVISCIANIVKCGSQVVNFSLPTASDNCSAIVTQTGGPVSGSVFTVGTTEITFTATDPAGNTATCTANVFINPIPTVNPVANQTYCVGDVVPTIVLSSSVAGSVFTWSRTSESIGLGTTSGTGDIPTFTATNSGNTPLTATFDVYASFTSKGLTCPGPTIQFTITVNPISQVNAVTNKTYCAGDIVPSIVFGSPVSGTSYLWIRTVPVPDIGLGTNSSTGNIPSFTATNTSTSPITSTFSVVGFNSNNSLTCSSPTMTFTITINPLPTVNAVTNKIYCTGAVVPSVVFSSPVAGATFSWSRTVPSPDIGLGSNSGFGNVPSFTAANASASPTISVFSVVASYTNNGVTCTGTPIQFSITINPAPPAPGPITGLNGVCRNQTGVTYCITPIPGITQYMWSLPPGAIVQGPSTGSCITLKFSSKFNGGPLCVKALGCSGGPNSCINLVLISVKPNTPGNISGPSTLCPLASGNFSIAAVPNASSYIWSGSGGLSIISGQGTIAVVVKAPLGFVSGNVKVKASNCKGNSGDKIKNVVKGAGCRIAVGEDANVDPANANQALSTLTVYPNPTPGKATVAFVSDRNAKYELKVVDLIGKVMIKEDMLVKEGYNEREINLENVAKGMYFISVQTEGKETEVLRIIVE